MLCSNTMSSLIQEAHTSDLWRAKRSLLTRGSKSEGRTGTRAGDLCHSPAPCLHLDKAFSFIFEVCCSSRSRLEPLKISHWHSWEKTLCRRRHSSSHHRECIYNYFSTEVTGELCLMSCLTQHHVRSMTFQCGPTWATAGYGGGLGFLVTFKTLKHAGAVAEREPKHPPPPPVFGGGRTAGAGMVSSSSQIHTFPSLTWFLLTCGPLSEVSHRLRTFFSAFQCWQQQQ